MEKLLFSNKELQFALNDTTTWLGIDTAGFYSKALLSDEVLKTFKTIPNVKSKVKVSRLDMSNAIQAYDDTTFTATDNALSQKTFTINPFKINLEIAQSVLEQNYLSQKLESGSLGSVGQVIPQDFLSYILDYTSKTIANDLHLASFGASSSSYPYNKMDSLVKLAKADSNTLKVTATASVTYLNVIDELMKVVRAIPKTIRHMATIYVSTNIITEYYYAVGKLLVTGTYLGEGYVPSILGVKIIEAQGLADNNMIAGVNGANGNFVRLIDSDSDENTLNVIPMIETLGIHTIRIVGAFKFTVGYIIPEEVVVYA